MNPDSPLVQYQGQFALTDQGLDLVLPIPVASGSQAKLQVSLTWEWLEAQPHDRLKLATVQLLSRRVELCLRSLEPED